MNCGRRLLFLLLLILFFFFSFGTVAAQKEPLFIEKIADNTFYDSLCLETGWSWLCQGEAFSLPALKKEDNWFYFSQGFFDSESLEKEMVFTFSPSPASLPDQLRLVLVLKSVTPAIGVVNLYFDWGQGWQIFPSQESSWLIFSGQNQRKEIFLKEAFPQLTSLSGQPWRLKIDAVPLISGQSVMLAVDQAAIIAPHDSSVVPTPTPDQTEPTPSPVPSPSIIETPPKGEFLEPKSSGRVYFNEAVTLIVAVWDEVNVEKIVLQHSPDGQSWWDLVDWPINQKNYHWSYRWYPEEEGTFNLRTKIYNQAGQLVLVDHPARFVFDQTPPEISWQKPLSQSDFSHPLLIEVEIEDGLSGIEEEPRFYYRYQDWADSWRQIPTNPWYFNDDLALGDYWLKAQVADRAGNMGEEEIILKKSLEIFNIFLVNNVLSWQTSHPTLCRLVYDQFSRAAGGLQEEYPNFGYAWASDQVAEQKTTKHQYLLPKLPPGEYFGRIIALERPIVYSQEFNFKTDNFFISENGENSPFVLGQVDEEIRESSWPSPTQSAPEENPPSFNWSRFLIILFLALWLGGTIVYLLRRPKPLIKDGQ